MSILNLISPLIIIDIVTIIFIINDERYFFDNEKHKLILLVIFLPFIGVVYVISKLTNPWYVGISLTVLILFCSGGYHNRWSFHICMNIMSKMGKLL